MVQIPCCSDELHVQILDPSLIIMLLSRTIYIGHLYKANHFATYKHIKTDLKKYSYQTVARLLATRF